MNHEVLGLGPCEIPLDSSERHVLRVTLTSEVCHRKDSPVLRCIVVVAAESQEIYFCLYIVRPLFMNVQGNLSCSITR